jgi:hypothetical protein
MSATSDYEAAVHARGWVYLPQLPGNSELGAAVKGRPGARSPWSPTGSTHELAPLAVQIEQGFAQGIAAVNDAMAPAEIGIGSTLENVAAATGLDHGVAGLLAKALGVPPWVLLVALAVFLFAVARQYKIVPPLREIV